MPLHGKIVVIKRSGGDGTEFPLTTTCLFGRKPDCDIRIQLPLVSREHCRIDLNENKEIILTNLSSANPTRVNGEALQQSERLKHGDVITIVDRSFRFEYPPAPTPKKRSSVGGKTETLKVLQDQQVGDSVPSETGEKRISQVSTDPHLKDGTNHDNIQRSLEKTVEMETKEEGSELQSKTASPFNDLYQMIKKSLDVKTPRKSAVSLLQTPTSRFCTPKPASTRKSVGKPVLSTEDQTTPKKDEAKVSPADEVQMEAENRSTETPKSAKKKQRRSSQTATETPKAEPENSAKSETPSPQKRIRTPPQRFTVGQAVEQICAGSPKSPTRRRSKEASPAGIKAKQDVTSPKAENKKASPRNSGKADKVKETSKKRKSGELGSDLPKSQMKKKRVSFGGQLSPELFDKRLPPDSPLRKGAAPRRSLGLFKPKQSLLRRASVIGLLTEQELPESPNAKSPAKSKTPPKKPSSAKSVSPKTPTPTKKSPKSRSPSPKAATPATKSKTPSPKAATPAPKTPKSKTPSPNKLETPKSSRQTPTVQGRFSVSRISTPSPAAAAEEEAVTHELASAAVTPKLPLRRKSIVRKTPKSALKVIVRRSGISRASMKVKNSWAEIVKFGQPKPQVAAPAKKAVIRKTKKKAAVPKPQTPARALPGHVSTGHACSPVTIVVSRAQKQKLTQPTGAAPRLVTNIAVLKKNLKMDEDLSGVSEMFKTPANDRKMRSVVDDSSTMKTPMGGLETPLVEPSVLNTPEEPGEMMVSPLSVSVKDRRYNSDAVQRLLNEDQDSSFTDLPTSETSSDQPVEEQCTDVTAASVSTPKQKPEAADCLTGVKRVMKTPKQKAEAVEDLRGRLLKTPKQKLEQRECLTGVKRIMKTPKQKAEPIEDLRGKILKTPKQRVEEEECLSGVKRLMKTPRQKPEQLDCLSGVKRIMQTPEREVQPLEDVKVKLLETPKQLECVTEVPDTVQSPRQEVEAPEDVVETLRAPEVRDGGMETPVHVEESEAVKTPNVKSSPPACLSGIKRIMKTPEEKSEPVEENFSIQALMKTPGQEEDFEGLQEDVEEPTVHLTGQQDTEEVEDQKDCDCAAEDVKELDFNVDEPQDNVPSVTDDVPQVDLEAEVDVKEVFTEEHFEEVPRDDHEKPSEAMETVCQEAGDELRPEEQEAVHENLSEEQPQVETATGDVMETETSVSDPEAQTAVTETLPELEEATLTATETETTGSDPDLGKKPVRGRRTKTEEPKAVEEIQATTEEPAVPAPVRGRRGKKTEASAAPAVRQTTRGRNTKTTESKDVEPAAEHSEPPPSEVTVKPKRGRNAKKTPEDKAETVGDVSTTTTLEPESQPSPPAEVGQEANVSAAAVEETVMKPKRGRRAKQPEVSAPVPTADVANDADADEVGSEMPEVVPEAVSESLPEVEAETLKATGATFQKKPVRGRRAKTVESKVEEKQEAEHHEEPAVPAPVRGRRGKKAETAAPAAVRQTTRGRNTKSQESTSDERPEVESTQITKDSSDVLTGQTSTIDTLEEDKDSEPPAEEAAVKQVRGRKTKQTPAEQQGPEKQEVSNEEEPKAEAEPPKSVPAVVKPRRGRKTKAETVEQNEEAEDSVATVETKQPAVRVKRGRNAKKEEEKQESTEPTEPANKVRRPRKAEQHQEETKEEVQTVVPEEAPPVDEEVMMEEQETVVTKPKRGGRKAIQDTKSESTEVPADKPKRGRRGKQVTEEAAVAAVSEEEPEAEEEVSAEPEAQVSKPRGRNTKASVKNEVSNAIPAKRARRGAAAPVEETNTMTSSLTESAAISVEPAKRGRRAAAKPTTDDSKVTNGQATPEEEPSIAAVEETKSSKRSVKWKPDLEVIEIPKVTPVKAVRGRKSKLADQVEAENKNMSKDANSAEEKVLSDAADEAQPAKRARRGAKVVNATSEEAESTSKEESVEAETQPKTRRGRAAKK